MVWYGMRFLDSSSTVHCAWQAPKGASISTKRFPWSISACLSLSNWPLAVSCSKLVCPCYMTLPATSCCPASTSAQWQTCWGEHPWFHASLAATAILGCRLHHLVNENYQQELGCHSSGWWSGPSISWWKDCRSCCTFLDSHVSFNWNLSLRKLERWRPGVFSVAVYNLLEHFQSRFQMWTFHFELNATFSIGFGNGLYHKQNHMILCVLKNSMIS